MGVISLNPFTPSVCVRDASVMSLQNGLQSHFKARDKFDVLTLLPGVIVHHRIFGFDLEAISQRRRCR